MVSASPLLASCWLLPTSLPHLLVSVSGTLLVIYCLLLPLPPTYLPAYRTYYLLVALSGIFLASYCLLPTCFVGGVQV